MVTLFYGPVQETPSAGFAAVHKIGGTTARDSDTVTTAPFRSFPIKEQHMSRFLPNILADFSETIVAVLAHSIWQSVVIALLVAAVLRSIPARRAEIRYSTAMGGLLSMLLMPFVTWSLLQLEFVPVNGGQ